MERIIRRAVGFGLLFVGAIYGLYGTFTLLYGGEEPYTSHKAYASLGDKFVDANIVGAVSVGLATLAVTVGLMVLRGR